jgi:hypothetical protein
MLALKAPLGPDATEELRASYELRLGDERFHIAASDHTIEVARNVARHPDATIDTDPARSSRCCQAAARSPTRSKPDTSESMVTPPPLSDSFGCSSNRSPPAHSSRRPSRPTPSIGRGKPEPPLS